MTIAVGLEMWMESVSSSKRSNTSAGDAVEINTPLHLHCFDHVQQDQEIK